MLSMPEPDPMETDLSAGLVPVDDATVAKPIPVAEFEGSFVRTMEGKLPAMTLDMPEGYARGTHLKMLVEVRVRNVRYEEDKSGELKRQHVFALEEIQLLGAYTAEEVDPGVGGNASAAAQDDLDDTTGGVGF